MNHSAKLHNHYSNNLKTFFKVWILLFILSCDSTEYESINIKKIYVDNKLYKDIDTLGNFGSIEEIIKLETSNKIFIPSSVKKIIKVGNSILIQDPDPNTPVRAFNKKGIYVNDFGTKGQGPGEYLTVDYLAYDPYNNHINIYDRSSTCLNRFTVEGNFLNRKKIPGMFFSGVESINKNESMFYFCGDENFNTFKNKINYRLLIMENNFNIKQKYLPETPKNLKGVSFVRYHFCIDTPEGWLISENLNDTIYTYLKGKLTPIYYYDFGKHSLPAKFINTPAEVVDGQPDRLRFAIKKGYNFLTDLSFQNKRYVYSCFISNGSYKSALTDKKNNFITRSFKGLFINNHGIIIPAPRLYDNQNLVSLYPAAEFKAMISYFSKHGKLSQEMIDLDKKTKIEDNPILFFIKLNE